MMIDPTKFLDPPIYVLTAAARMQLTLLGMEGRIGVQSNLQTQHRAMLRERVPALNDRAGVLMITDGLFCLCVIDSILPDDYLRRTVICVDTELEDVRIKMFQASGLIPTNKKE